MRRNFEVFQILGQGIARQIVEHFGRITSQRGVAGKERQVGVNTRGDRVIVARSIMRIGHQLIALAADHGADFCVGFVLGKPIDHMRPSAFQTARLANVRGLVKTRFQLDQSGDRFTVLGCFAQGLDDGGFFRCAIQGLFDRNHVRVTGRLLQEANDHVERFIGVMQQHVLFADRSKHITVMVLNTFRYTRGIGRPKQVGPFIQYQFLEVGHADHAIDLDNLFF